MQWSRFLQLLNRPYQGNLSWALFAVFSAFMALYLILQARRKRMSGQHVDMRTTAGGVVFLLGFVLVALFQVVTHR